MQESSDFTALRAAHNMHDTHDVSGTDQTDQAESIWFSSRLKTSTTAGFQHTELRTTEYITIRMKVIDDGPGVLSDRGIYWIKATGDVQLEVIDVNLSESLKQAEKVSKICDLNESLAAKVQDLEAAEPVRDSPSREYAAAQQEIEELEKELQIKKCQSTKLERQFDKSKSEPETTKQTDITQLRLEKDMLLHQLKNLSSGKSSLESELRAFKRIIQPLTTNKVLATPAPNSSQQPPGLFKISRSSEPISGLFRIHDSAEPTPGCLGAVASLSSHLTFRCMRANEPGTMSPPSFLRWSDTFRMQPRSFDGSAHQAAETKQCYN